MLQFLLYTNFSLDFGNWGIALPIDVVRVLDSVIANFYGNLNPGLIPTKPVQVLNGKSRYPPLATPMIVQNVAGDTIYLATEDWYWAQYVYQFVHELCHHIVDSSFFYGIDRFGWLEESLCELASIYTLNKMSATWLTEAPLPHLTTFATELGIYSVNLLDAPTNSLTEPLHIWLADNIAALYNNRIMRTENQIVAARLFPLFAQSPELWQTVQYINRVTVTNNMDLKTFLGIWKAQLPVALQVKFSDIERLMVNEIS